MFVKARCEQILSVIILLKYKFRWLDEVISIQNIFNCIDWLWLDSLGKNLDQIYIQATGQNHEEGHDIWKIPKHLPKLTHPLKNVFLS